MARITSYEVMAVREQGDEIAPASAYEATAWGVYVTYADAPTMHTRDYATQDEAEKVAAVLADCHGVPSRTLPCD